MSAPVEQSPQQAVEVEKDFLLHYLQAHEALCPLCKYNLKNLTEPRCPECGKQIKLTVGLAESPLAPFVVVLVALGLPAGVGVVAFMVMIQEGTMIYHMGPRLGDSLESLSLMGFQASLLPLLIAIFLRRRIFRLSRGGQWAIAGLSLVEPACIFGLFLAATLIR